MEGAGEHGIYVEVPGSRTGTLSVVVSDVVVRDNGCSGLWVDDQVNNSPVSLSVRILRSEFRGNSRGIRIEELQAGDVLGQIVGGTFDHNDSDGVRVEEYGDGDINLRMQNAALTGNGGDGLQAGDPGTVTLVRPFFDGNGGGDINEDGTAERALARQGVGWSRPVIARGRHVSPARQWSPSTS